jgi:hypothetical protein
MRPRRNRVERQFDAVACPSPVACLSRGGDSLPGAQALEHCADARAGA